MLTSLSSTQAAPSRLARNAASGTLRQRGRFGENCTTPRTASMHPAHPTPAPATRRDPPRAHAASAIAAEGAEASAIRVDGWARDESSLDLILTATLPDGRVATGTIPVDLDRLR